MKENEDYIEIIMEDIHYLYSKNYKIWYLGYLEQDTIGIMSDETILVPKLERLLLKNIRKEKIKRLL